MAARLVKRTVEDFIEKAPATKKARAGEAQADDGADDVMDELSDVDFEEGEEEHPRRRRRKS